MPQPVKASSFNLTLTARGLRAFSDSLRQKLYQSGVPMPQRVIHHSDGSISYQRYGTAPEHHLLSIPRGVVHGILLEEADRAGAKLFFEHECVSADLRNAVVQFVSAGKLIKDAGDVLLGCDGANSFIRYEMARSGARLNIRQDYISHSYVEIFMPPIASGDHALLQKLRNPTIPDSAHHGLHMWPRGKFVLIAQPNVDKTYTTTLFMPLSTNDPSDPALDKLVSNSQVNAFFEHYFPDVVDLLPHLSEQFLARPPASLKIINCNCYHYERAVLLGDAAHTMVPFYGQGINCSFEDLRMFFALLDNAAVGRSNEDALKETLPAFTTERTPSGDTVSQLSLMNLQELARNTGEKKFHARSHVEQELYRQYPNDFTPLYCMVAFSSLRYDEAFAKHKKQKEILDRLCRHYSMEFETDKIIGAYIAQVRNPTDSLEAPSSGDLDLSPEQMRDLMDLTSSYVTNYYQQISRGEIPASYVHDSLDVSSYEEGKRIAAELREDQAPDEGTAVAVLLDEVFGKAMANGTLHPHPGFMAHIPSGGLLQGAVGELIARATNRFAGVWIAAPGLIQLEINVINWFCSMLGYSEGSFGYLTTGGSIATTMGISCAVHRCEEIASALRTIYVSSQGHFSVAKAARMIGFDAAQIRTVRALKNCSIDVNDLISCIERDIASGLHPTCVVATAGTTNTGAIDDLVAISEYCKKNRIWLHVDACFGGFFAITKRGKAALKGIETADSISVDAHKSLFLPHGISALLVKDRATLRKAFEIPGTSYLPGFTCSEELVDFCNYGPELSRNIRGLTAWLPLKMHGIKVFERCLDERLDLAEYLASELSRIAQIEVINDHPMHLPVVNFRIRADLCIDADSVNERLCEAICSHGRTYVTTTKLPEHGTVVRACVLNHRTNRSAIDDLIDSVLVSLPSLMQNHGVIRHHAQALLQDSMSALPNVHSSKRRI